MKKTVKLLIFALALCLAVCAFASCEASGAEVSEEEFKAALDLSGKNLTMTVRQTSNGSTEEITFKYVGDKTYVKSSYDTLWDETSESFDFIFDQIAECYGDLSFADGVYTADKLIIKNAGDEEFEASDVLVKINSRGEAVEVSFGLTDGEENAKMDITFSDYGKTKAPASFELQGSINNTVPTPEYEHDPFFEGVGREVDADGWQAAFDSLATANFYAEITLTSPEGQNAYRYVLINNSAYYGLIDGRWTKGDVSNFTEKVMPFAPTFEEFSFVDGEFVCEESSVDAENEGKIRNLHVVFDEEGRLVTLWYDVEKDGESGRACVNISTYGNAKQPMYTVNIGEIKIPSDGNTDLNGSFDYVIVDPNGNQFVTGDGGSLDFVIIGGSDGSFGSTEYYPDGMGQLFPADPEGDADGEESGDKVIENTGASDTNGK